MDYHILIFRNYLYNMDVYIRFVLNLGPNSGCSAKSAKTSKIVRISERSMRKIRINGFKSGVLNLRLTVLQKLSSITHHPGYGAVNANVLVREQSVDEASCQLHEFTASSFLLLVLNISRSFLPPSHRLISSMVQCSGKAFSPTSSTESGIFTESRFEHLSKA